MIGIDTLIGGGLGIVTEIIKRVWPDPAEQDKAKLALLEMQQKGELAALDADLQAAMAQAATNTAEAQSGNLFLAGWRPAVGWVCAIALAYNFIIYPILAWAAVAINPSFKFPPLFQNGLFDLVLGMLGLGGLRTFEKVKGITK